MRLCILAHYGEGGFTGAKNAFLSEGVKGTPNLHLKRID